MKRVTSGIALALLMTACSAGTKVGDEDLFKFKDKPQERLGDRASPTASPTSTVAPTQPPKQAISQPPKATQPAATFKVNINSDGANAPAFDPPLVRVAKGTTVIWTNNDSVPRSVEADEGTFNSPAIAPKGTWSYTATSPGKFNYHDGSRPYAVASLEVVAT